MIAVMSGALLLLLAFALGFFMGRGAHEQDLLPVEPAKPDEFKLLKEMFDLKVEEEE